MFQDGVKEAIEAATKNCTLSADLETYLTTVSEENVNLQEIVTKEAQKMYVSVGD